MNIEIMKFRILALFSVLFVGIPIIINCSGGGGGGGDNKSEDPNNPSCVCMGGKWAQSTNSTAGKCAAQYIGKDCQSTIPSPTVSPSTLHKATEEGKKGALEKGAENLKNAEAGINEAKKLLGPKGIAIQKKK